jgi:hypothetical protein
MKRRAFLSSRAAAVAASLSVVSGSAAAQQTITLNGVSRFNDDHAFWSAAC